MASRFTKHVYFTILLLVLVVFATGVLLGRSIASAGETEIEKFIKDTELDTESFLIEQQLMQSFDEEICDLADIRIDALSEELGAIGRRLTDPTARNELGESNFNFLKRKYHIMQIRTYFLFKKLIDNCAIESDVILYYYSTNDEESANQGPILDAIVGEFNVKVFAVEYDYSSELSFLEQYYGVEETPTLIVNYDKKMEGLAEYGEIVESLE